MAEKITVKFQKTECGRCGGSGRYSYNQIHGDMCYGCKGRGTVLTRDGQAASKIYWDIARPEISAADVKLGDKLYMEIMGQRIIGPVTSIVDDEKDLGINVGQNRVTFNVTVQGKRYGWGTFWSATVKLAATAASKAAAREAIQGHPGAEILIEEVAA